MNITTKTDVKRMRFDTQEPRHINAKRVFSFYLGLRVLNP